jgi:hypothetical protein
MTSDIIQNGKNILVMNKHWCIEIKNNKVIVKKKKNFQYGFGWETVFNSEVKK